ncbi:type II secretion system secretin GspD [Dyella sp. GSA-30]|uniref:type II secretion system secretin GspD n=1 Tax=Dyella sp. GSA-30 TaxID=2994496 RepID=UPI0024913D8E|nr:type II secretion system secretin GspD [Dyella sp. GSA-30]BDU19678.1 type II secretion system protein GspD [Dyella sp. GSA-30]
MSRPILQLFRIGTVAMAVWITGCSTLPNPKDDGVLQREAMAGTEKPAPEPVALNKEITAPDAAAAVRPQVSEGTGQFIRPQGLATPIKAASGDNAVTFNFENQPVPAVVKVILGDLLKQNYTIVPGVQGNISFSTSQPVDSTQAIPILETLLSWTGNALVKQGSGYVVMPSKDAVGGNVAPSLGAASPQAGLQARLYPLHYISANEMQKLIKPFARPESILLADPARNVIVLSGTPEDLANYERTVKTFDVDWLRGMSIGVYSLQRANVTELMPKLDSLFGPKGDTPLAGMLRFIPIERTNSLVVITTQPSYLSEVGGWIEKIDRGGGNEPQLFVYDVRNLKASDLAQYLAQIYASSNGNNGGNGGAKVGPGLTSGTLGGSDNANGSANGLGSLAGSFGSSTNGGIGGGLGNNSGLNSGGIGSGTSGGIGSTGGFGSSGGIGSNQSSNGFGGFTPGGINSNGTSNSVFGNNNGQQSQQYSNDDGSIRISSVDANNQLLVRAPPSKWDEINSAIKRLDTTPLQVQIETRILEVTLTGDFQFGVQWYLEGLIKNTTDANGNIVPGQPGNQQQGALGVGGANYSPVSTASGTTTGDAFYYSFVNHNLQVALRALETSGKTKTLSAPSMVVLNNQVAQIQVGDQVPISSTTVNTGLATGTVSTAQYIPTGVILGVQPRVNPGGLVYMNVMQQVSQAGAAAAGVNPTISQRALSTQVAVQSGQTVLLGGLIQQLDQTTDTGIPGLNQIPILGRLFGSTNRSKTRTELIVLITPRVITNGEEAKQITDEYQQKFESLAPLRESDSAMKPAVITPLKP